MVHEIGLFEAERRLGELIDRVERGAEITITRGGKPVAKLVPTDAGLDRAKAKRAVEGIARLSKGLSLRGLKIKDLVNQGRP